MEFVKEEVVSNCEDEEEMVHVLSNSSSPIEIDKNPLELEICDDNTKKTRNKCGEIYTSEDEVFTFLCTFCFTLLEDIEKFINHVRTHQMNKLCSMDKTEDLLEPSNDPENSWIKLEPNMEVELVNDSQISLAHSNEISENGVSVVCYEEEDGEDDKGLDACISAATSSSNKLEGLIQEKTECDTNSSLSQPIASKKKKRKKHKVILLCDLCSKEFISEKTFEIHRLFDHIPTNPFFTLQTVENENVRTEDSDREKKETSTETVQSLAWTENDPLKCRYCERRLSNRRDRYEHECSHTGEKPYTCEICEKTFRTNQSYKNHAKMHTDERPYKCEYCDATFKEKPNLIVHIRRHLGEKPYKCRYCEKTFVVSTGRKQHERVHTGERPYQCVRCGMCFLTSGKLCLHNKKHLGIRPHKCNDCGRSFYKKQDLTRHSVKHTGERPFTCGVCNATFRATSSFTQHKKTHLDVEGYVCKICGKGFKVYQGLYSHMKSHGEKLNSSKK